MMGARRTAIVLMVSVLVFGGVAGVLVATSGPVGAQTADSVVTLAVDALAPSATVPAGQQSTVEVQVSNDGYLDGGPPDPTIRGELTAARNVRIDIDDDDTPLTVRTSPRSLGTITTDQPRTVPLVVDVPDDVEAGAYELDVSLRYRYSPGVQFGEMRADRRRTVDRTIEIEVDDGPRFDLQSVESMAQAGSEGTVTTAVRNTGTESAHDVTVALESTSDSVTLGGSTSDATRIDRLGANESTTVTYDVAVANGTTARNYTLEGRVSYTDAAGIDGTDEDVSVGLAVREQQAFELDVSGSPLRVGEQSELRGTVRNTGPFPVDDLTLSLADGEFESQSRTHAIGSLDVGETATFQFRATVPETADPVPRRVGLTGRYETAGGERTVSESVRVPVTKQRFDVAVESSTLRVGERGVVRGTVRNEGPASVEGVTLSLAGAAFASHNGTYAVGTLGANESEQFQFRVSVPESSDAVPQRIDVTTRYRTDAGRDRTVSETTTVPVAQRRDAVAVTPADATFTAGESGDLVLDVRNQREETVEDVRVDLAVQEPLESEFTTAVVPELAPEETGEVRFDLDVDSNAPPSQYPATVTVEYVDANDDPATVRPATVPVTVTEASTPVSLSQLVVGVLVLVVVVAGGWWFYGRRLV